MIMAAKPTLTHSCAKTWERSDFFFTEKPTDYYGTMKKSGNSPLYMTILLRTKGYWPARFGKRRVCIYRALRRIGPNRETGNNAVNAIRIAKTSFFFKKKTEFLLPLQSV